jgi:CheY-like chemotaxis protein
MPTILVVEDNPILRNLMLRVLTNQGFRVFEADTPEEALSICGALRDEQLDLLIADHGLPAINGRALAESILEGCPNIKVLELSVSPYMEREDAMLPAGFFLQKPFSAGQLLQTVETILSPRMQ